jgi:O-antigen/teichoic acid export membrane protein
VYIDRWPPTNRLSTSAQSIAWWFKDQNFQSLLRNSGYLAVSRVVAGAAGLISLALTGRALGVLLFGTLMLINSYARLISGLAKFQSWQLVVRYGGRALDGGDALEFRDAIGFAIGLDLLGSIAATTIGIALVPLVAHWFGIPKRYLGDTILYCTLLPLLVPATPMGVLRSLDRFDLIAWQGTIAPIARAILICAAWAMHAELEAFLTVWYVTIAGSAVCFWILAWRELRRRALLTGIRPTLRSRSLIGAWHFAVNVNISTALAAATGPLARLLVGALLGPIGAGLYRTASAISKAIGQPAGLLAKAFYPELMRMDIATRRPWLLMLRSAALSGVFALVAVLALILFGRSLIELAFGRDFVGVYYPMLVLALVPLLGTISFPAPWMLYALDRPRGPAAARLVCVLVYLCAIAPLTWTFGLVGTAAAVVAGEAARVLVMTILLMREYRSRPNSEDAT